MIKTTTIQDWTLSSVTVLRGTALSVLLPILLTYPAIAEPLSKQATEQSVRRTDSTLKVGQAEGRSQVVSQAQPKPDIQTASSSSNTVGLVKSFSEKTLELRLADGTCRTFTAKPGVLNSLSPRRGTLVALNTDNNGLVTGLQPAEVDRTINGVITNIKDDQVTLQLPNSQIETTRVAPETAARLQLAPGVPLTVTSYRDTPTTRVCVGKAKPVPPVTPVPVTAPPTTAPPVNAPPVRALW